MVDKFAGFFIDEISGEHKKIINKITAAFKKKDWVRGILLTGSYADENIEKDIFSDIDICIVIKRSEIKFIEKNIKAVLREFTDPVFFHRVPCGNLSFSLWALPFIRIDISFKELKDVNPRFKINRHVKILFDRSSLVKNYLKNKKTLTKRISLSKITDLDALFWMTIFFIFTKIERNDFCAVYDAFHLIVVKVLLKLRKMDYNSPPDIHIHNIMKKDPFLYQELEVILDFPNEPTDSMLRSIILYKNLVKRVLRQEGLSFEPEAEQLVLRTIQRGLISKPKRWG
ncbi:MAG TPA: hypothetical protein ENN73_00180 [Firmicutes bacterium]|nr:hypothetical protein [Bacillota bacterium]